MKTGLERGAQAAGLLVLLASLVFLASLLGPWAGLPLSLLLGIGVAWLWTRGGLSQQQPWLVALLCVLASVVPTAASVWLLQASGLLWFTPLIVGAACVLTLRALLRSRLRCSLCNRRLAHGDVAFRCPRCTQTVCDQTCWEFEHRRCRLCLEQRVPILPVQDAWWLRLTGPRAQQGRCSRCLGPAEAVDLRLCPHCRRPQCRDCWDFANGDCSRCGRTLPELPESLTMATVHVASPH